MSALQTATSTCGEKTGASETREGCFLAFHPEHAKVTLKDEKYGDGGRDGGMLRCGSGLHRASVFSLAAFLRIIQHRRTVRCSARRPFPRGGHRLQRAFCVKRGAEPPAWKFPSKSCDWLVRRST